MWKQQRLHDYLIESSLVTADQLSVYTDEGTVDWVYCPTDQSYRLLYRCNLLIKEYSRPAHLLFLAITAFLDEYDPNHTHKPAWQTAPLKDGVVTLEVKLHFQEEYRYRRALDGETPDGLLGDEPVVLEPEYKPESSPDAGDGFPPEPGHFLRFRLMPNV